MEYAEGNQKANVAVPIFFVGMKEEKKEPNTFMSITKNVYIYENYHLG